MAVNLSAPGTLHVVPGVRLGTVDAGIRKAKRPDLVVVECDAGTQTAAVFTKNRFCAAPVIVARQHLARRMPRALLVNTGFANAGTGEAGLSDARACCDALAKTLGCSAEEVLPFSTGVIGERFPLDRIVAGIPVAVSRLAENGWTDAAQGIMTTDTVAKGVSRQVRINAQTVTITGITKGAGMIRPDMATMLAFIATDARIAAPLLQQLLGDAVDASFNRISIDGDTSTNDACVLLASGKSASVDSAGETLQIFKTALTDVCQTLAQAIVRDGEGATKFITVDVAGGASEAECLETAYTIAHSPLVKTAFFASDPNWGRILAAIGRAPVARLDVDKVSIHLDDVCVVRNGGLAPDYTEARGSAVMRRAEITIHVHLGLGNAAARVWTTDLSHDYVRINAEYRS
jgi:glutamate N-acetyltransferase/amino-acid N-acetyltransferase